MGIGNKFFYKMNINQTLRIKLVFSNNNFVQILNFIFLFCKFTQAENQFADNYELRKKGWGTPWNIMYSEEYKKSRRLEEISATERKLAIQELFDNPNYILLDVRNNPEETTFQFTQETKDIFHIQAKYAQLPYDDVKEKPYELFKAVGEARNPGKFASLEVNPLDPINPFRNQPILILCGQRFCGCRMMFSTWYGFTNVTTLQHSMDYLPGGLNNAFELE